MTKSSYVFGYGSLISSDSRARGGYTGGATPADVTGIQRAWNYVANKITHYTLADLKDEGLPETVLSKLMPLTDIVSESQRQWQTELRLALNESELAKFPDPLFQQAALGVYAKDAAITNGVLISVSEDELARLDRREDGYKRTRLDELDKVTITILDGHEAPPLGAVWIYFPENPRQPAGDCPIIQSYVDVVLTGCILEFGQAFTRTFVRRTESWDCSWVDDRHRPVNPRAMGYATLPIHIDRILAEEIVSGERQFLCNAAFRQR